jgi:NHL repeat
MGRAGIHRRYSCRSSDRARVGHPRPDRDEFSEPKAAATGPNGEIYVTDAANNRVEIWKP